MAVNKNPWRYNIFGAQPFYHFFPAAAGSSQAIKMGEICVMANGDTDIAPMAAVDENVNAIVIPVEEQKSTDVERFIKCIVPKYGDVFEFDLDTATQVQFGTELKWSDSQTLTASSGTDTIAVVCDLNPHQPASGATQPTVSTVRVTFLQAAGTSNGYRLPFCGICEGDAS